MTAEQYRWHRKRLGLSHAGMGEFLNVNPRTSRGWQDDSPIPEATAKLLRLMVRSGLKPEDVT
jgi:hypothetical protein